MRKGLLKGGWAVLCCFFFLSLVGAGDIVELFKGLLHPEVDHGPNFSSSKFHSLLVGLEGVGGHIACFGDFNSDIYNDVFIISDDAKTIYVYLWNHERYVFVRSERATLHLNMSITNIAAADFNYDGRLDILVSGPSGNGSLYLHLYFGNYETFYKLLVLEESLDEVLILDQNGDLLPDLFGTARSTGKRTYWINRERADYFELVPQKITGSNENVSELNPLIKPGANAFVDLNGDCLSDLYLTSLSPNGETIVEIWLHQKASLQFDKTFVLPFGAGQPTFADFDADGTIDLLLPICNPEPSCSEENAIYVIFNHQKHLCKGLWDDNCRHSSELCTPDMHYLSSLSLNSTPPQPAVVVIPKHMFGGSHFFTYGDLPLTLRTGDYNLDGYPDLLIPLLDGDGRIFIQVWQNVKCEPSNSNGLCPHSSARSFVPIWQDMEALTSISNAYAAAFFDLDENGMPDVLILTDDALSTPGGRRHIRAVFNNFQNDAFFLKTLGLNGVCVAWCEEGPKFPHPKPYGVNYAGSVFKFTVTDMSGEKRVRQGGQLYQSAYLPLQTPYLIFGLGRTSNYIDEFFYGLPVDKVFPFLVYC